MAYFKKAFSPTWIVGYDMCPFKQVNEKFKESAPLLFGKLVHDLSERAIAGKWDVARFKEVGKEKLLETAIPFTKFSPRLQKIANNFFKEQFQIKKGFEILDLESKHCPPAFKNILYGKPYAAVPLFTQGRKLRGSVDRIDIDKGAKRIHIRDYKTGTAPVKNMSQLFSYAVQACIMYDWLDLDEWVIVCSFDYLEMGKQVPDPPLWAKPDALVKHISDIRGIVEEYDGGIHSKRSGSHCRFCSIENCEMRKYPYYGR